VYGRSRVTASVTTLPTTSTQTPVHFHGSMPSGTSSTPITSFHSAGHTSRVASQRASG